LWGAALYIIRPGGQMNKVKILFILPRAQSGGAERQLFYLLSGLDKKKFEVYLGFLYEREQQKNVFHKIKGIHVTYFRKRCVFDVSVYLRIAKFIEQHDIDIVHSFMEGINAYLPSFIAGSAIPAGGIMSSFDKGLTVWSKIERFFISKLFTKYGKLILISCSYSGMNLYLRKGFQKNKVFTIPNGIDYDKFSHGKKEKITKEFDLKNDFVIGSVGRLIEVKNYDNLIRMFSEISKEHNLKLLIVGAGPMMKGLKNLVSELHLSDKVILTGNRTDVPDLLARMDIFVFPSLSEGWPNALGEAMSAGLPVISYDVGDVKYVIKEGINGVIVKNDMASMKKRILELMKSKTLRVSMGIAARKTIMDNFSVERMVQRYESAYLGMISSNNLRMKRVKK
jgi:glycosyltransferase involved in cell wall biosynthesis